jgi:hypothetical protein
VSSITLWARSKRFIDQSIHLDKNEPNFQDRVCQGTLRQLYDASTASPEYQKSLSAIGLPMPNAGVQKAGYATDVRAHYRTKHEFGTMQNLPTYAMLFGLAATSGAHHWWHIDSRGDGTMVSVAEGQKFWALAEPKDPSYTWSTEVWSKDEVDVRRLDPDKWHIEVVVLNPGDRLYVSCHKSATSSNWTILTGSCAHQRRMPFLPPSMQSAMGAILLLRLYYNGQLLAQYIPSYVATSSPTPTTRPSKRV